MTDVPNYKKQTLIYKDMATYKWCALPQPSHLLGIQNENVSEKSHKEGAEIGIKEVEVGGKR